jgi:hypothetical protein
MNVTAHDVHLIGERRAVLITLPSFEWDFTPGLRVRLRGSGLDLDTRQIGTGNHEGRATIMLSPQGEWDEAERALRAILQGGFITLAISDI